MKKAGKKVTKEVTTPQQEYLDDMKADLLDSLETLLEQTEALKAALERINNYARERAKKMVEKAVEKKQE